MFSRIMAWFAGLPWLVRTAGSGLVSYSTPRALIAAGVPIDDWLLDLGSFIGLHFDREVAFWAAVVLVGLALFAFDRIWKVTHIHHLPAQATTVPLATLDRVVIRGATETAPAPD